jgi:hypothetical protein
MGASQAAGVASRAGLGVPGAIDRRCDSEPGGLRGAEEEAGADGRVFRRPLGAGLSECSVGCGLQGLVQVEHGCQVLSAHGFRRIQSNSASATCTGRFRRQSRDGDDAALLAACVSGLNHAGLALNAAAPPAPAARG